MKSDEEKIDELLSASMALAPHPFLESLAFGNISTLGDEPGIAITI